MPSCIHCSLCLVVCTLSVVRFPVFCIVHGSLWCPLCLFYSCLVSAVRMVTILVCGVYSVLCMVSWCMQCVEMSIVYSVWFAGVCSADGVHVAWWNAKRLVNNSMESVVLWCPSYLVLSFVSGSTVSAVHILPGRIHSVWFMIPWCLHPNHNPSPKP